MNINNFDYTLPTSHIAIYPEPHRTQSRLLALHKTTGALSHHTFKDIIDFLKPNDVLVLNNSRVIPARLFGKKTTGGKIEILIERLIDDSHALAHVKSNKALKADTDIIITDSDSIRILDRKENLFHLRLDSKLPFLTFLHEHGHIPLPPYIERSDKKSDLDRYQTVYAKPHGSVAAPTAGLHFDDTLLNTIRNKGIEVVYVTLHVGAGTFQPVRTDSIHEHRMHAEWIDVPPSTCDAIKHAKGNGGRVIAVGTTSVRSLETAAQSGTLNPYTGDTNIFIYPGYRFQCVDAMITNFHLPKSTLLMLVSAFASLDHIKQAYQTAIEQNYRFYSYGDAMLIYS